MPAPPASSRGIFDAVTALCALTLGVTLYALTRDVDRDLAMFAMGCRLLIPAALAWLGFVSSALLIALKVMHLSTSTTTDWSSPVTWFVWLPTRIFELTFAVWLLTKV